FAASIDLILNLDRFVDAARDSAGKDASALKTAAVFVWLTIQYQGPRLFQFYAYLHGMVAIGAMGFTLSVMHRWRELTALLATGISMHRLAMPFMVGMFALSLIQLANQELILPTLAPMLLREPNQIAKQSLDEFEVPLAAYGANNNTLIQAPAFDPAKNTLISPTIWQRDERGRTKTRLTANLARWDPAGRTWKLTNGQNRVLPEEAQESPVLQTAVDDYAMDVTPEMLTVKRYGQYASMLSMGQISMMLQTPGIEEGDTLRRYLYSRFSVVLINLLVMVVALPCFLLREPANLLIQSMKCASFTVPTLTMASVFMMVKLEGIAPIVAVFLPVLALIPFALARVTYVRT
ncbi:MAG TPA: LptF/LptG family permease, partial [Phycisphaerales bacterium]|nr:LptF/LptG family permease [Phycisphaerales bacterium]